VQSANDTWEEAQVVAVHTTSSPLTDPHWQAAELLSLHFTSRRTSADVVVHRCSTLLQPHGSKVQRCHWNWQQLVVGDTVDALWHIDTGEWIHCTVADIVRTGSGDRDGLDSEAGAVASAGHSSIVKVLLRTFDEQLKKTDQSIRKWFDFE
jgi:hypothetical protein